MQLRARRVFALLTIGMSLYFSSRIAMEWTKPDAPFLIFLDELEQKIPRDARVLLVTPHSEWRLTQPCLINSRLHPRVVYNLPPGVETLEGASAWIAEKRFTWVVSLGGSFYDPARAFARKLE